MRRTVKHARGFDPAVSVGLEATRPETPIIVSITTLPSRIDRIRPCLESLLSGTRVPDSIFVTVPFRSIREETEYSIPPFLLDETFCKGVVRIVRADRDWGPGTKLLGSLHLITEPSYIVIADDDVSYEPNFIETILDAQQKDHRSSFSNYTYRIDGITIGQGCDGFSFWSPNISDIRSFAEAHVVGSELFFHDDLWISFYLAARGISIKRPKRRSKGLVYEQIHEINSLRYLQGSLARDALNRKGVRWLMAKVPMPPARRLRMEARGGWYSLVQSPLASLLEKIFRRLHVRANN